MNCNQHIKFAAVLERAQALGFDAVGTGHYARLVDGPDGVELHRAVDPTKDQSYVLGVPTPGSWRLRCSHWATATSPKSAEEAAARVCWWRTSRTATTSASSPTGTPGIPARPTRR